VSPIPDRTSTSPPTADAPLVNSPDTTPYVKPEGELPAAIRSAAKVDDDQNLHQRKAAKRRSDRAIHEGSYGDDPEAMPLFEIDPGEGIAGDTITFTILEWGDVEPTSDDDVRVSIGGIDVPYTSSDSTTGTVEAPAHADGEAEVQLRVAPNGVPGFGAFTYIHEVGTRVNRAINPSFENGTSTYSALVSAGFSRPTPSSPAAPAGTRVLDVTPDSGADGGVKVTYTDLDPTLDYTVSWAVRAKDASLSNSIKEDGQGLDDSDADVGSLIGGTPFTHDGGAFVRRHLTFPAAAGRTKARVSVKNALWPAGANGFQVDAFLCEEGDEPGEYFDGDSPGAQWDDLAHFSTSRIEP
jgi:IPT/TIG domain